MESILLSPPDVGQLEADYVLAAIREGWIAPAGPDLQAFESEVAGRVGRSHAVGLASGTAALHLALVSWGVGPGDVVPVSTLTFAATANAVRYTGATPFFVDCDAETGNISVDLLEQSLQSLRHRGISTPVVVPVDLFGRCADYSRILPVAEAFGARVLADAAESFGSSRDGVSAGSEGDAGVLSFNGNKVMTTSGGGMLLTDDARLAEHVRKLSSQAREPVPHYEHREVGFNYRLSNLLAALGRAQLVRLDEMIGRRRAWRDRYRKLLTGCPGVRLLGDDPAGGDNCWITAIVVDPERSPWTNFELAEAMSAQNIETRPIWKPMHDQPVWAGLEGMVNGAADQLFRNGLCLPSGSAMTDEQFKRIESVFISMKGA